MKFTKRKELFLLVFGLGAIAMPTESYSRFGGGGHRGGEDRSMEERSYGRDRRYPDENYHHYDNYRRNDYNRYGDRYLRDRNYNNEWQDAASYEAGVYADDPGYIPTPEAESYNDITNPVPGDESNSTNFQNSNFNNQIWDMNN